MSEEERPVMGRILDISIRLSAIGLLFIWCFKILEPFIILIVWSGIIAIALHPAFNSLKRRFGNRKVLAAIAIIILMFAIMIIPSIWLLSSAGGNLKGLTHDVASGKIDIPAPPDNVKQIPVVGASLFDAWTSASTDFQAFIQPYSEQIKSEAIILIDKLANTGKDILVFALSIIIAAFLLVHEEKAGGFIRLIFIRLAGDRGKEMVSIAEVTVRNVARGILGLAFLQTLLAGIGMFIVKVPIAVLWIMLCFIFSIVQIGILPIGAIVVIYMWYSTSVSSAIFLAIWFIFVAIIEAVLKPLVLGKGAPVPMLVVFMGALGGFVLTGFSGLFTGAIVLSLGYKLLLLWMTHRQVSV